MDLGRRPVLKALMRAVVVIEVEVAVQPLVLATFVIQVENEAG
jgi:hypothetical protein